MNKKTVSLVYPQLPKAGLGNMLLIWAKAVLFAHINQLPIVAPTWGKISIGPYLRGEKDKRYYGNLFCNQDYISQINYLIASCRKKHLYHNPPIDKIDLSDFEPNELSFLSVFIFSNLPHWSDYFGDIKEYQPIVKQKLLSIIRQSVFEAIFERPEPEIGIHIRMGDFKTLKPNDNFSTLGSVRTPLSWFMKVIEATREIAGYNVPVTVFSDGHDHELEDLLKLPNISRATAASALSDMLTLSRSKLLITSSGSTFSSWASYLGQCPTIWHPAHFHVGVFPEDISQSLFEGGFNPELMPAPDLLLRNIKSRF